MSLRRKLYIYGQNLKVGYILKDCQLIGGTKISLYIINHIEIIRKILMKTELFISKHFQ